MSIQTGRLWLAAQIPILDPLWTVTTATWPELTATYTVEIGHAPPTPETFRAHRVDLPVTWWVNEGNEAAAAGRLYEALSFAPTSLVARLARLAPVDGVTVDELGPELFRDSRLGVLRAVSTVRLNLTAIPEADEDLS